MEDIENWLAVLEMLKSYVSDCPFWSSYQLLTDLYIASTCPARP